MKKKIILSVIVFSLFFAFAGVAKVKAAPTDNVLGWIWGGTEDGLGNTSGLGWISTNNLNPKAGGAIGYGINIPPTGVTAGSGYLWSENVGEIDFEPQNHCTTGVPAVGQYKALSCTPPNGAAGVSRPVAGELQGWARFVQIAKASAVGNNGGWEGWIKLKGNAQNGAPYGVAIDAAGKMSGYAWSNELGAISFRGLIAGGPDEYGAEIIGAPQVTLNAAPPVINVDATPLPQNVVLSWNVKYATQCTKSGGSGGIWSGTILNSDPLDLITGSDPPVSQSTPNEEYTLTCTGPGGTTPVTITVLTFCNKHQCGSSSYTCDAVPKYGATSTANCSADQLCSTDSDCAPRNPGVWKEVSP